MTDIIRIKNALPENLHTQFKRNIFNCGWFIVETFMKSV